MTRALVYVRRLFRFLGYKGRKQARNDAAFANLTRRLSRMSFEDIVREVSKYPCGCDVCSAGTPHLCNNDCERNGRVPTEGGE